MAKLHPLAAIAKAQEARSFLAAFAGHDFSEFAVPGHHDRRHLAAALDHMEELAAMLLAMAEQAHNAIELTGSPLAASPATGGSDVE